MEIKRAEPGNTNIFPAEKLRYGGCCFYSDNRECTYFFDIKGREAVLYADKPLYLDDVINEFLFYSNFVKRIYNPSGRLLHVNAAAALTRIRITDIQPSQFFINEQKLANCMTWITSFSDVYIPVAAVNGQIVALDGHTRLRAAWDLGYTHVYAYQDDSGGYIKDFADEAVRRGIRNILGMEIVSDENYRLKWHKYCDDFFADKDKQ